MKPIRYNRIISLFMVCCLLMSVFAAPVTLAVTRKDGVTKLQSSDWKIVTVNGKKAFNLTVQDFSDAYDSLASGIAKNDDDELGLLMNLVARHDNVHSKIDINGATIDLYSTQKATNTSASKGKITKIVLELPHSEDDYEYPAIILAIMLALFSNYDQDKAEALLARMEAAVREGKSKISFTRGNLKYVMTFPDSSIVFCTITVTPK